MPGRILAENVHLPIGATAPAASVSAASGSLGRAEDEQRQARHGAVVLNSVWPYSVRNKCHDSGTDPTVSHELERWWRQVRRRLARPRPTTT